MKIPKNKNIKQIKKKAKQKKFSKFFITTILIFFILSLIFVLFQHHRRDEYEEIDLTQFVKIFEQQEITKIRIINDNIFIYQDEYRFKTRLMPEINIFETLKQLGVQEEIIEKEMRRIELVVEKEREEFFHILSLFLIFFAPLAIFILIIWIFSKKIKKEGSQIFDFMRANTKTFNRQISLKEKISFKDVAGLEEVKQELKEMIDFLKFPKKYIKMGAKIPKGILLVGPPGVGKTLLAKALASEANVPFFFMSGSEFVEMFVGVGASRVRNLFNNAKKVQPSIIFIDELDAIGRRRGSGLGGGHDEREQALNQILVEMDGFERNTAIIVLAATNRPDVLDPALLRPGRFDRRSVLDLPDIKDRVKILKIHIRKKPISKNVNLKKIAEQTPGFSGADLFSLVNEATILATNKKQKQVSQSNLLESIEKVMLGPQRKSHLLSKKEKKIVAYHEAGHAIVSFLLVKDDLITKISIIARGRAAGYILKTPREENRLKTRSTLLKDIVCLLGGYAAEEIIFQEATTGAYNDLEEATKLAKKIVKNYGMSKSFGPAVFIEEEDNVFIGRQLGMPRIYSEVTASKIDIEVISIVKDALKKAKNILSKNKDILEKVAKELIRKETLEVEEIKLLMKKDLE